MKVAFIWSLERNEEKEKPIKRYANIIEKKLQAFKSWISIWIRISG